MAKKTTKPGRLFLRMSSGSQGSVMISEGAMIHSAPNLSARAPTIGPVTKVGADAATVIVSDTKLGGTNGTRSLR